MRITRITSTRENAAPMPFSLERLWTNDWVMAGSLMLLGLITRLPFLSHVLYHWDSVNFAFAMQDFNLAKDQPQPPGYIIYVELTRLVDTFFHDAQSTLVAISVGASVLSLAAIYFFGKAVFNRQVGLVAALFLTFSPLYWFYGEIALPHPVDALLVTVSAWWLYKTMRGDLRYLFPAVAIAAIAGGVRQQTLVFLAPLILFSLRKVGWKNLALAGALGAVICLAWFLPLISLSGGLSSYLQVMNAFSARFQSTTSLFMGAGLWGLTRNVTKLTLYTLYSWSVFALPLVIYAFQFVRRRGKIQSLEKLIFFTLWIAPALIFYTIIHMGQQGLVFVYLPALLVISAAALVYLLESRRRWLFMVTAGLVLINASIFLFLPEYPLGPNGQRLLTRATIVNSDNYFQGRFNEIESSFSPGNSVIIASNWHHLDYYLPQYTRLPFTLGAKWEVDQGQPDNSPQNNLDATPAQMGFNLAPGEEVAVVIFDPDLDGFNQTPQYAQQVPLPDGSDLQVMYMGAQDRLVLKPDSFSLIRR